MSASISTYLRKWDVSFRTADRNENIFLAAKTSSVCLQFKLIGTILNGKKNMSTPREIRDGKSTKLLYWHIKYKQKSNIQADNTICYQWIDYTIKPTKMKSFDLFP